MTDAPHNLVLTREMDAPREKLWRCWTEPKLLERWFCPELWYVTDIRLARGLGQGRRQLEALAKSL